MCNTSSDWLEGAAVFVLIAVCCLGFVVFGTSKQSLSGLKHLFLKGPPPGRELAPYDEFLGKVLCFFSGLPRPPTYHLLPTTHPHLCLLTKVVLFLAFLLLTGVIMLFFAVVPLYPTLTLSLTLTLTLIPTPSPSSNRCLSTRPRESAGSLVVLE